MIIDSHIHIPNVGGKKKNLFDIKNELLDSMKKNAINYAIAIPMPDNVPNSECAYTKILVKIIEGEKQFFSMGTIDVFQKIDGQIKKLDNLLAAKKICGIKLFPGHDPFYPIDEIYQPVYKLCAKHDLPVVVHTGITTSNTDYAKYNDPKYLVEITKKYRNLKIVIAHFFWPKMGYCYKITKDLKNIYYDTSAMADPEVVEATGGWNKVLQVLKKTVSRKPNSVMFGTDWPMCPVDKHIKLVKEMALGAELEKKIFFLNAINLYKLEIL